MNLEDIKLLLIEYKKMFNCKNPYEILSDKNNYKELNDKDRITLKMFEFIISYLEEKELKDSGFYD